MYKSGKNKPKNINIKMKAAVNAEEQQQFTMSKNLEENLSKIKKFLNNSFDISVRRFRIAGSHVEAAIVFIDSLSKEDTILEYIMKPLMRGCLSITDKPDKEIDIQMIKDTLVTSGQIGEWDSFDKTILEVLSGNTLLVINGLDKGITINTREAPGRSIDEPKAEQSVKGPREAFVENLKDNIGLLRKRLKDPNFTFEMRKIGRRAKADVIIAYIKGIADEDIVKEVRKRLSSVDIDDGVAAGQIEHLISDHPNSIFPLIQSTERPDKAIAGVLEGRVAIIIDGTCSVLIVPATFAILMQSVDDYNEKWIIGSVIRLGRYAAFFTSALLPGLYIAATSFHPGILPTNIMLSIAGTRQGIPFPAFIEAFLMIAVLELLLEAGIRLPKAVGQTVSIVGGLVIGQAAVEAGIISPVLLIVVSVTAISSFVIPNYSLGLTSRIVRVPFMIIATILGAVGTSLVLLALLGYTASLKSFGVGYLEPIAPYHLRDWKDTLIRGPQKVFDKRPEFLSPEDTQRQNVRKGGGSRESK
ncbi:MAG: spore germination protein [Acetivibrionales bacterium]|jgi:spore germination protein